MIEHWDGRGKLICARSTAWVDNLLRGATVIEVTGSGVVVELPDGRRYSYRASGWEFDMELQEAAP